MFTGVIEEVFGLVDLQVYCALILMILLPTTIIYNRRRKKGTNRFIILMYLSFFLLIISDIVLKIFMYKNAGNIDSYYIIRSISYIGYSLACYFWFLTCESEIGTILYEDKLLVGILSLPVVLAVFVEAFDKLHHMIFYFDGSGNYFRVSGFYIISVINAFYLLFAILHTLYFAITHDDDLYRKEYRVITVVGGIFLIACLLHSIIGIDCLALGAAGGIAIYYQVITAGLNYREERRAKQREDFLQKDNQNLNLAVGTVYTLVFSVNLTANRYHVLGHDGSMALQIPTDGTHDDLIRGGMTNITEKEDRDHFYEVLYRENQIAAYKKGNRRLKLRYHEMGADGCLHFVETVVIFLDNTEDIQQITFVKNIDDEATRAPIDAIRGNSGERAQSAFWSSISQDIKTPINGIIGMTEIAKHHMDDKNRIEECLEKIDLASQHLLSLANDVFDLNAINDGDVSINNESINLIDFSENCVNILKGQLLGRDINFSADIDINHPNVMGDDDILKKVLLYLLGNAVKFTPDGGKVVFNIKEVTCNEYRVRIRIVVSDSGIGMKPEFIKRVWEPFSPENRGLRSGYQGTGLGMAIMRRYVEILGGAIALESELGKGSTFTIDFSFERVV